MAELPAPASTARGYTASKARLLKRLWRIEGQVRGIHDQGRQEMTEELMAAVGRLVRS